MFFYTPTEVVAGEAPSTTPFRVGGLVTTGSVQRQTDGLTVQFDVTDNAETGHRAVHRHPARPVPRGTGHRGHGRLRPTGVFVADEVLAKHDENYMPPEVADSLKTAHEAGSRHNLSKGGAP